MGSAVNDVTQATREVLLDGPTEVAAAAEEVRRMALALQPLLKRLVGADDPERREEYDRAYQSFRQAHNRFIELARQALEVGR